MRRGSAVVLAIAAAAATLEAHAGLRFSNPIEGVALGDSPATIQLTMAERPEVSLSSIQVADVSGLFLEARSSIVRALGLVVDRSIGVGGLRVCALSQRLKWRSLEVDPNVTICILNGPV